MIELPYAILIFAATSIATLAAGWGLFRSQLNEMKELVREARSEIVALRTENVKLHAAIGELRAQVMVLQDRSARQTGSHPKQD